MIMIHLFAAVAGPKIKPKSPHSLPPLLTQKSIPPAVNAYRYYEPIKMVKGTWLYACCIAGNIQGGQCFGWTTKLGLWSYVHDCSNRHDHHSACLLRLSARWSCKDHTLTKTESLRISHYSFCTVHVFNVFCFCAVTEPRPVVLLGAHEAELRRYLVEHGSNSDIKFAYCKKRNYAHGQ